MGGQADIRGFDDAWRPERSEREREAARVGLAEVVPIDVPRKWPAAPSPVRRSSSRAYAYEDEEDEIPTTGHVVLPRRQFAVVRVRTFGDARNVAQHLENRTPVLLDLSGVDADMARRIIDFSSGIIFGTFGDMKRVDTGVFLLVPAGVDIG